MKKIKVFILLALVVILLGGCSSDKRRFYHEVEFCPCPAGSGEDQEWKKTSTIEEPSEQQKKMVRKVFQKLREVYQRDIEEPTVKIVKGFEEGEDSYDVYAFYSAEDRIIYLLETFSEDNIPVLAHEMMHYFSDNGKTNGISYLTQDKSILLGQALTEGIANYFSTKVYPFTREQCVYEYETHVAEMLALVMGEEELADAFFSSNVEKIRKAIMPKIASTYSSESYKNEYVAKQEFDCFDVLVVSVDSYHEYLSAVGQVQGVEDWVFDMAESVEETLMTALSEAGKLGKGKKILSTFIRGEVRIAWSTSNLPELLK